MSMRKTSIFTDHSVPTEIRDLTLCTRPSQCSLGSNQEGFERSNPQVWQAPTSSSLPVECREEKYKNLHQPRHRPRLQSIIQANPPSTKAPSHPSKASIKSPSKQSIHQDPPKLGHNTNLKSSIISLQNSKPNQIFKLKSQRTFCSSSFKPQLTCGKGHKSQYKMQRNLLEVNEVRLGVFIWILG